MKSSPSFSAGNYGGYHHTGVIFQRGVAVMKRQLKPILVALLLATASPLLMADEQKGDENQAPPGCVSGYGMGPGMMHSGPGYGPGYGMGPGMMQDPRYSGRR